MNAVAVVRPNPDLVQTDVDLHPNMLKKELEVTGHVPALMATWLTRFLKRQTNIHTYIRYLFIHGKIFSLKKINKSNTVLQDCRVGARLTITVKFVKFPTKGDWSKRRIELTEEVILVSMSRVNTFFRVTICSVSGCIGRIEEKFTVERWLGLHVLILIVFVFL